LLNDSLLALASVAIANRYVCPRITEGSLMMEKMRHPIIEHQHDRFVTNDINLGGFQDKSYSTGILLTGPNASGKSVYLQEVAVIVYMAHIGSFVPCSSAVIGITDKILTRIRTQSSVSKHQSTFMIDLKQANAAVRQSTSKSLVILDEFGKGTSPSDGIALFASILHHLSDKNVKFIAATHFYEILTLPGISALENLSLFTMSIHSQDGETNFLYQLVPGRCPSSLGIRCAQLAGNTNINL
jgi:DNA mismatch repair protein MSH5